MFRRNEASFHFSLVILFLLTAIFLNGAFASRAPNLDSFFGFMQGKVAGN